MNFFKLHNLLNEESPDTLEGSFSPDLIASKEWLCKELKKHVKGLPVIYVLGSWYGNIILSLKNHKIPYKAIFFVETDKNKLNKTKKIFGTENGKLHFINKDVAKVNYDDADIVINTSSNEMSLQWYKKIKKDTLVVIQGRNNTKNKVNSETLSLDELDERYPMNHVVYLSEEKYQDPETNYNRFMKIGYK